MINLVASTNHAYGFDFNDRLSCRIAIDTRGDVTSVTLYDSGVPYMTKRSLLEAQLECPAFNEFCRQVMKLNDILGRNV